MPLVWFGYTGGLHPNRMMPGVPVVTLNDTGARNTDPGNVSGKEVVV